MQEKDGGSGKVLLHDPRRFLVDIYDVIERGPVDTVGDVGDIIEIVMDRPFLIQHPLANLKFKQWRLLIFMLQLTSAWLDERSSQVVVGAALEGE